MRLSLALLSAIALGCGREQPRRAAAGAERAAIPQPDSSAILEPEGFYFLQGEVPEWAQRIDHLDLSHSEVRGNQIVPVPLAGALHLKTAAAETLLVQYRLVAPRLVGRHLTFITQVIEGLSFRFEGEFVQAGNLAQLSPQGVVLAGRLQRLEGGQVVAQLQARFTYFAGD